MSPFPPRLAIGPSLILHPLPSASVFGLSVKGPSRAEAGLADRHDAVTSISPQVLPEQFSKIMSSGVVGVSADPRQNRGTGKIHQ